MEQREETSDHLNAQTSLALGKLAHVEDMLDMAMQNAEELKADIRAFKTRNKSAATTSNEVSL